MSVGQGVLQLRQFEAMAREVRENLAHHDATHATAAPRRGASTPEAVRAATLASHQLEGRAMAGNKSSSRTIGGS